MPIKTGYTDGEWTEVRSGLKPGEPVVTAGKVALREGSAVQVIGQPVAKRTGGGRQGGQEAMSGDVQRRRCGAAATGAAHASRRRRRPGRVLHAPPRHRGMFWITMVLFGLIALSGLKVNLLPDLSYPTLTVRTEYTGAAPSEIETLITQPVEEAVGVVKNLRKMHSVSRTGQSDVVLEFAWGTDMDQAEPRSARQDRSAAAAAGSEEAGAAALQSVDRADPAPGLTTEGEPASDDDAIRELNAAAPLRRRRPQEELEPVDGVAAVKVGGGLEDEIEVDIDQQQLAQLDLPIDDVDQAPEERKHQHLRRPHRQGTQRFLVRTVNQFASVDEIANMLVTTQAAGGGAARKRRAADGARRRGVRRCQRDGGGSVGARAHPVRSSSSPAACRCG